MNRSLKLSMMVALALGGSQLLAMELGQVQVKSALGQPLLAEIPLHPGSPGELKGLTVKLASSEQFARAGIVGGRTSIPLHFSVANVAGAHPVIRITSSVPVNDPYLDLLIEVDGRSGPSVREYAILLDPPGMHADAVAAAAPPVAPASTAAPAAPAASNSSARGTPASTEAAPRPAASVPAPTAAGVSNGRYGPVQSGQTLSGVARSVTPPGVDVKQMLVALQQANPDAFYHDNINALKRGAVLRVPTAAEAQAVSLAEAVAQVRRQNSDWRAGTPGKPAVVADAATHTPVSAAPDAAAGKGDRLALVPAQAGAGTAGRGAAGQGGKSAAEVREELLRARESMASLQQQGNDLKARLKDLSDINSKNEHLLSLKDSEIAELQAKLAATRKATGAPADPAAGASVPTTPAAQAEPVAQAPAVATAGSAANPMAAGAATSALAGAAPVSASSATLGGESHVATAVSSTANAVPASVAAAPTASHKAAPLKRVPAPVPAAQQPWYMQAWAWVAGAAVVVLLLVLAMLGRRRKPADANAGSSLADRFGTVPVVTDHLAGEGDTDQEQLLDQLAEHPEDIYLHLELVTLYYSRRDVERFEAAAEAMHAHITDPAQEEWQDVVRMGEDLAPEHPLFDHHHEPVLSGADAADAFDIDDYTADDVHEDDAQAVLSPFAPAQSTEPAKVSEYNFDFDLTHPAPDESEQAPLADVDAATFGKLHGEPLRWDAPETDLPPAAAYAETPVEFSDDPVDTKLDLARAYVDMGDADGARAMLGEVLKEGSQMQRDTARKLLDGLH